MKKERPSATTHYQPGWVLSVLFNDKNKFVFDEKPQTYTKKALGPTMPGGCPAGIAESPARACARPVVFPGMVLAIQVQGIMERKKRWKEPGYLGPPPRPKHKLGPPSRWTSKNSARCVLCAGGLNVYFTKRRLQVATKKGLHVPFQKHLAFGKIDNSAQRRLLICCT